MSQAELRDALPEPLRKHLDPGAPMPARMMAAKGLVPMGPRDMTVVLCGLSFDADEKIAGAAKRIAARPALRLTSPRRSGAGRGRRRP